MMSKLAFDDLTKLYKETQFSGDGREGSLRISSERIRSLLMAALEDEYRTGVTVRQPTTNQINVGDTVQIHVDDPKTALGLVADTFDDVLSFPGGKIKEPPFFLKESMWANGDSEPPMIVRKYRALLEFVGILIETAAYVDKENQELIFFVDSKLSLPIIYTQELLEQIDIDATLSFVERVRDEVHAEQKEVILSKTLSSILGTSSPNERFARLLACLPDLVQSFEEGYKLFVANFSYEKIKDEIESAKLEEMAKIHKTFSDVQNQILSIPIATIIVATQLRPAETVGIEFWVNTAVILGVWIFVALTTLVLRNQSLTLDAIGDEINRKKRKVDTDYVAIKDMVSTAFETLDKRLRRQKTAFKTVVGILFVGFAFAHIMYFALTEPSWDFVQSALQRVRTSP